MQPPELLVHPIFTVTGAKPGYAGLDEPPSHPLPMNPPKMLGLQNAPAAMRPQLPPATQAVHAADVAPSVEKLPAAQFTGAAAPPVHAMPP